MTEASSNVGHRTGVWITKRVAACRRHPGPDPRRLELCGMNYEQAYHRLNAAVLRAVQELPMTSIGALPTDYPAGPERAGARLRQVLREVEDVDPQGHKDAPADA